MMVKETSKRLKEFNGRLDALAEHSEEVMEDDEAASMFLVDTLLNSDVCKDQWIEDIDAYSPISDMEYEEEKIENARRSG